MKPPTEEKLRNQVVRRSQVSYWRNGWTMTQMRDICQSEGKQFFVTDGGLIYDLQSRLVSTIDSIEETA